MSLRVDTPLRTYFRRLMTSGTGIGSCMGIITKGLLLLICLTAPCLAAPITYKLVGVTFGDGGTASGLFTYDVDTETFASIDITTSVGSWALGSLGSHYTSPGPGLIHCCGFFLVPAAGLADFTGTPVLSLGTFAPLTDAGGAFQIGNFEGVCADAGCAIATNARLITSGTISSVPEPSTTLAVGFGALLVLGAGMLRRFVH